MNWFVFGVTVAVIVAALIAAARFHEPYRDLDDREIKKRDKQ